MIFDQRRCIACVCVCVFVYAFFRYFSIYMLLHMWCIAISAADKQQHCIFTTKTASTASTAATGTINSFRLLETESEFGVDWNVTFWHLFYKFTFGEWFLRLILAAIVNSFCISIWAKCLFVNLFFHRESMTDWKGFKCVNSRRLAAIGSFFFFCVSSTFLKYSKWDFQPNAWVVEINRRRCTKYWALFLLLWIQLKHVLSSSFL